MPRPFSDDLIDVLRHHSNRLFHTISTHVANYLQRWKWEQLHSLSSHNPMLPCNPSNLPNNTSPISVLRLNHALNPLLPNVPLTQPSLHTLDPYDLQPYAAHYPHPVTTHAPRLATPTPTCLPLTPNPDTPPSHPVDYLPTTTTTIPTPPPRTPLDTHILLTARLPLQPDAMFCKGSKTFWSAMRQCSPEVLSCAPGSVDC